MTDGNTSAEKFPLGAVEHLRRQPIRGRLFNADRWGGNLIWSFGPEQKVFIDGRADIYEYSGALVDYFSVVKVKRNTVFPLRKYNVNACLIEPQASVSVSANLRTFRHGQ